MASPSNGEVFFLRSREPGTGNREQACLVPCPAAILTRLVRCAAEAAPRECCGLLIAERDALVDAISLTNVATADDAFRFDPLEYARFERRIRAGGRRVAGYYHSHPSGSIRPSRRDRGMLWAEHAGLQMIVTPAGDWALWQPGATDWCLLAEGRTHA